MNVCRCNVCNAVNYLEIANWDSPMSNGAFHDDPSGIGWICDACSNVVTDAIADFREAEELEDEEFWDE